MKKVLSLKTGHQHGSPLSTRKDRDKSTSNNYRPQSLTCILCKAMKYIVCSQIGHHLDDNNILHPNQHGFRKRLSCETQLISSIQDWASSIDSKRQTEIILLDLRHLTRSPIGNSYIRSDITALAELPTAGSMHS